MSSINLIFIPSRPQPDTIVAIFLLKTFGKELFPGVENAKIEVSSEVSKTFEGSIALDVGGGELDHHKIVPPVTCSELVARKLGIEENPAIAKLLEYSRRDDMEGKGTVSSDPLDKAFGLSGLVAALNKTRPNDAAGIVKDVLPLIEGHYREEVQRTVELPKEFEKKKSEGKIDIFEVRQRDKKLSVIILESDNTSMPGFLRSQIGGRFDVVVQRMSSGHTNILTRPTKRIDLRSLALVIRLEEANQSGVQMKEDSRYLSQPGKVSEVSNWYYDVATNSIQNGGANPKDTIPTRIDAFAMRKLIEVGLEEKIWSPMVR